MSEWSEERIEEVKRLWQAGLSATQIARQMGDGMTRNAVLSKIHRMGAAVRSVGHKGGERTRTGFTRSRPIQRPAPLPRPSRIQEPEAVRLENGAFITTMDLQHRHCRWPIGEVGPDLHYCGHDKKGEGAYCAFHTERATTTDKIKRAEWQAMQRDRAKAKAA